MSLLETLLNDQDGDGIFDSLKGKLFLPAKPDVPTLRAASEVLGRLSTRTARLQPDVSIWKNVTYGFFIGVKPPTVSKTIKGLEMLLTQEGLGFLADSSKTLLKGAGWFSLYPYLLEGLNLENFCQSHSALRSISWYRQTLRLAFAQKLEDTVLGKAAPASIRIVDGAIVATLKDLTAPQTVRGEKRSFSLGNTLHGGGLYSGTPDHPEHLQGTLHVGYPIKEALHVAARLSTEGLSVGLPVTSARPGIVHLGLDQRLKPGRPEIRVKPQGKHHQLEIAGNTEGDLSRTARFFAERFPVLPDGPTIHELETSIADLLHNRTRLGRLASLAVTRPRDALRAFQVNPLYQSPQLLNAPVRNSLRDGQQWRWQASFPWEGTRFLETIKAAAFDTHKRIQVRAFLSESQAVRETLAHQARTLLKAQGIKAEVEIFSAFKPGFYWLLEHIAPRAKALKATQLEVVCGAHKQGVEVQDRWLRELYPIAEALEQQYGFSVSLRMDKKEKVPYLVRALSARAKVLLEDTLDPPVHKIPVIGREKVYAFPTTGQVTIHSGDKALLQVHIPTDRDLVWDYYTRQVLPELSQYLDTSGQPLFSDLSIRLDISEADDYTGVDHEYCSAVEAMHEEFYFGSLEVFSVLGGQSFAQRQSTPGWILPFCKATPAQDTRMQVVLNLPGTQRLGWETRPGRFQDVKATPVTVSATTLQLNPARPRLALDIVTANRKEAALAAAKVQWLIKQRNRGKLEFVLSEGTDLELNFKTRKQTLKTVLVKARRATGPNVPDIQRDVHLHPQEVVTVARDFSQRFPEAHLKPLKETRLGQPLVCLELGVAPGMSRARLAHWKPTLLISARQHANEPTSTHANFLWLNAFASDPLLKKFNTIFHPLENPDGARLYNALRQVAGHHMHHAARYTSLGSDIETTPPIAGKLIAERQLHEDARARWRPLVHLNNHGYPAHEWTRPHSGYVPAHFEDWSLPFGYLAILLAEPEVATFLTRSQKQIAQRLTEEGLAPYTLAQIQRNLRYRHKSDLPFTFERGLPFLIRLRSKEEKIPTFNAGKTWLTLISEVPDESVKGQLWQDCVRAHQEMNQAVLEVLDQNLEATSKEVFQSGSTPRFTYNVQLYFAD